MRIYIAILAMVGSMVGVPDCNNSTNTRGGTGRSNNGDYNNQSNNNKLDNDRDQIWLNKLKSKIGWSKILTKWKNDAELCGVDPETYKPNPNYWCNDSYREKQRWLKVFEQYSSYDHDIQKEIWYNYHSLLFENTIPDNQKDKVQAIWSQAQDFCLKLDIGRDFQKLHIDCAKARIEILKLENDRPNAWFSWFATTVPSCQKIDEIDKQLLAKQKELYDLVNPQSNIDQLNRIRGEIEQLLTELRNTLDSLKKENAKAKLG